MGSAIKRYRIFAPALLLVLFFATPVFAAETINLYVTEMPVQRQSASELDAAAGRGLANVIVRLTGSEQGLLNPEIASSLAQSQQYLKQFNYKTETVADEDGTITTRQSIVLEYQQRLVDQLVRRAGLPIWDSYRPNLLVWLTVEDQQGRHMLNAGDHSEIIQSLKDQGEYRGIPLIFPLGDLEDQIALPASEAWALFQDSYARAATRYGAEALIAGRAYQDGNGLWQSRWLYTFDSNRSRFEFSSPIYEEFAMPGVKRAIDELASRYSVLTGGSNMDSIRLQLAGVDSVTDYADVTNFLFSLASVRSVRLTEISGERVVLDLQFDGTAEKLQETIELVGSLGFIGKSNASNEDMTLLYEWLR